MLYGGVLSGNRAVNPDFWHWNAVFVTYCDFASFGSSRAQPIVIAGTNGEKDQFMYMRGRNNFNAGDTLAAAARTIEIPLAMTL